VPVKSRLGSSFLMLQIFGVICYVKQTDFVAVKLEIKVKITQK
jgi:hypothetical protein